MPISPDIFDQEEELKHERHQGMMSSMGTMFVRNLKSAINEVAGKSIFKVEVQASEQEAILKKILGLLHSISAYMKLAQNGQSPSQKISIKTTDLVTLNKSIEDILKKIESKELKVNIPSTTNVQGEVKISNFPKEYSFDKIYSALTEVKAAIQNIRLEAPQQREIRFPDIKIPEFPKSLSMAESRAILEALRDVSKQIKELPKNIPKTEIPSEVRVSNFPPQKYPMPVTHISINSMNGTVKTRAVTVTTDLTPLPGEVLAYRRSLTVYNNGSVTIYIGGSTMTVADGLPVPAGTYSPALDAGPRMILYARTSSSTCDVRVMEVSDEDSGR